MLQKWKKWKWKYGNLNSSDVIQKMKNKVCENVYVTDCLVGKTFCYYCV